MNYEQLVRCDVDQGSMCERTTQAVIAERLSISASLKSYLQRNGTMKQSRTNVLHLWTNIRDVFFYSDHKQVKAVIVLTLVLCC